MSNQISYSNGKFTLVLDEVLSNCPYPKYNRKSSDADLVIGTIHHDEFVSNRGRVVKATSGAAQATGATNGFASYLGRPKSGLSYSTYYALGSVNQTKYYRDSDGAWVNTNYSASTMLSANPYLTASTMVSDILVAGMGSLNVGAAPQVDPDRMILFGGTSHTTITTGTATFTTGSKTVSLSSALSAGDQTAIVGSFIVNTQDTNQCAYRVTSVASSTSITIDRNYGGSRSAAASTYIISPAYSFTVDSTVDASSGNYLVGRSCVSAWGRLVVMNTTSNVSSASKDFVRNRIRWSGAIGSVVEGAAPFIGMYAWDANGYLDLPAQGGAGVQLIKHGNAVVAMQQFGMTVIYGSPTFNDIGSLDVSTYFDNLRPLKGVSTPYGLFFLDRFNGLMVWNGGTPRVATNFDSVNYVFNDIVNQASGTVEIEYYNDYLIISSSKNSASKAFLYHIPTAKWSWMIFGDGNGYSWVQKGRTFGSLTEKVDHPIVAISSGSYTDLVILSNVIDKNATEDLSTVDFSDWDNTSTNFLLTTTKQFGDPSVRLRPERLNITYKTSVNNYTTITMPSNETITLPTTSGTWQTRVFELQQAAARNEVYLSIVGANCVIASIVIEGTIEGEVSSV